MFPGLASYLVFLTFYLSRDFETVAQRDWHASLCIVLGLLILQGWPGRTSRIVSALLGAAALATRPHAVLFLPAMAAAVLEGARGSIPTERRPGPTRLLLEWFLALAMFTAMAFAPLLIAGIADDLIRGLKVAAFGGPYNRANPTTAGRVFVEQLMQPATWIVIGLLGLLIAADRGAVAPACRHLGPGPVGGPGLPAVPPGAARLPGLSAGPGRHRSPWPCRSPGSSIGPGCRLPSACSPCSRSSSR